MTILRRAHATGAGPNSPAVGLLINVATSVLFPILILQDQPSAAQLIGYGVSIPYNFVAIVGLWRAAEGYNGPAIHADLARSVTVMLMAALSLT